MMDLFNYHHSYDVAEFLSPVHNCIWLPLEYRYEAHLILMFCNMCQFHF